MSSGSRLTPRMSSGARRWLALAAAVVISGAATAAMLPRTPKQDRWEKLWETMLEESLHDDLAATNTRLDAILADGDDPSTTALAQFETATVAWAQGDATRARDQLDACIRGNAGSTQRARCLDLRGTIDLETDAVRLVPTTWDFADPHHGVLHPRAFWDQGTIRLSSDGGASELVWTTKIDSVRDDRLVVAFQEPTPPPRVVRVKIVSSRVDAALQVWFADVSGRRYAPPGRLTKLPVGQPQLIEIRLADLIGEQPGTPAFNPAALHRMELVDRSSMIGSGGENELRLDSIEVR